MRVADRSPYDTSSRESHKILRIEPVENRWRHERRRKCLLRLAPATWWELWWLPILTLL